MKNVLLAILFDIAAIFRTSRPDRYYGSHLFDVT